LVYRPTFIEFLTASAFIAFAFRTGTIVFQTISAIAFGAIAIGTFTIIHGFKVLWFIE
jgi:hypothetical protein